jgi:hypothetical protein
MCSSSFRECIQDGYHNDVSILENHHQAFSPERKIGVAFGKLLVTITHT